jgi:hypothetical protein
MRGRTLLFFKVKGQVCSIRRKKLAGRIKTKMYAPKIIQLGILDHHHEREGLLFSRSKVKVIAVLSRKTL